MINWELGIAFLMAFSMTAGSGTDINNINIEELDQKQAEKVIALQNGWEEHDTADHGISGREIEEGYVLSESIMFTDSFEAISYGDVIGSMEVEYTNIDCDIIYAENKADAIERSEEPGGYDYVYLFYEEGGKGLNASYMNFYAAEELMPDYEMVDEAGEIQTRYLHAWIRVGKEELKMDISGIYCSDDMGTDHGTLIGLTEPELLPPDAKGDEGKINYIGSCLQAMPEGIEYDRMITISSYNTDHKRIIVAVNMAE